MNYKNGIGFIFLLTVLFSPSISAQTHSRPEQIEAQIKSLSKDPVFKTSINNIYSQMNLVAKKLKNLTLVERKSLDRVLEKKIFELKQNRMPPSPRLLRDLETFHALDTQKINCKCEIPAAQNPANVIPKHT